MVQPTQTGSKEPCCTKTTIETEFKTITGRMLPSQQLEYCETEFMRTSVKHPPMIKRKDQGKDKASIQGSSSSTTNESFVWSVVFSRQTTPLAEKQELLKYYTACLGSNHDISADEEDLLLGLEFIVE